MPSEDNTQPAEWAFSGHWLQSQLPQILNRVQLKAGMNWLLSGKCDRREPFFMPPQIYFPMPKGPFFVSLSLFLNDVPRNWTYQSVQRKAATNKAQKLLLNKDIIQKIH